MIVWDTTESISEYPELIKKIYFNISIQYRKNFTNWIGGLAENHLYNLDLWSSIPFSRNKYLSDLFHVICVLETLSKLKNKNIKLQVILLYKNLGDQIYEWSKNKKIDLSILVKNKKGYFNLTIFKSICFYFFTYFWIKIFYNNNILKQESSNILITTFAKIESKEDDLFFPGLINYLNSNNKKNVFFVPTFLSQKNIFNTIKEIKILSKKNYVFKEAILNLNDIIYAAKHVLRVNKLKFDKIKYKNWDLKKIFIEELTTTKNYSSKMTSILNYKFVEKLSKKNLKVIKTIDLFENQIINKGWNMGFRKFYPKTKTFGYQNFTYYPHNLNLFPSTFEEKAKVVPSRLVVIGNAFKKSRKEFFPRLKVNVGPALRYQHLLKKQNFESNKQILIVLNGISLKDNIKLLNWIAAATNNFKKIKIYVKEHLILKIKNTTKKKFGTKFEFTNKKFSTIIKKSSIVVSNGPTSATVESLVYNSRIIVPVFDPADSLIFKNLKIKKKNVHFVFNLTQLKNKINHLVKQKLNKHNKIDLTLAKYFFSKINDETMRYFI